MSAWEGKTRGGKLGYQIFIWTLKNLGLGFAYFLLKFVAFYFLFATWSATRNLFTLYRKMLGYGTIRSCFMIYGNFNLFGQVLLDKVVMMAGLHHKFTFSFEGDDYIRGMKDGGLLVSAHMGNWEIAGQMLNMFEKKVNVLLFDAEHQQIKGYLDDVMTERNVHFIVIRDDFSHLTEIRDAFANKEIVAMHGDRYIEGNRIMMIDFLGKPAAFPTGPLNLAAKFGVPVTFVFGIKTKRTHYHFSADKPRYVEFFTNLKLREIRLQSVLGEFVQNLEQTVRKYPLQWFNYYDFWALPNDRSHPLNPVR